MSRFNNQPAVALDYIKSVTARITQLDREGGLTRDEMGALLEAEKLVATGLSEWTQRVADVSRLEAQVKELEAKLGPKAVAEKPNK